MRGKNIYLIGGIVLCCLMVGLFLCFSHHVEPPKTIPEELYDVYTMEGKVPVSTWYFDNSYPPSKPLVYTQKAVNKYMQKIQKRESFYYGPTDQYLYQALDAYSDLIKGKKIGIIGSVTPLYESMILSWGGEPITIEYNKIVSQHPSIKTMTVNEFDVNPMIFDAILCISSIEHDGLGRYGDPLNPNGDVETMSKFKKMLKKEGILILAMPVGQDRIFWNAHRVYGKLRLPKLLQEWKTINSFGYQIDDLEKESDGSHQPIFILKPIEKK